MKNETVLFTGATGIMGSWVLADALDKGIKPVVLMRDDTEAQARQRIEAVLSIIARGHTLDEVEIVQGDVARPGLGLDQTTRSSLLPRLGGIIHCAASTSFSPKEKMNLWHTNVVGAQHVLDAAKESTAPLYHVSTAYIAGTRTGAAFENEHDENQLFKTAYEYTKFSAEHLIHEAIAEEAVEGAVFRPAIIVGAASNGTIAQFLNFYDFLRLAHGMKQSAGAAGTRLRALTHADTTKNIVPVDWVAHAMWCVIDEDGASGKCYHLTNPNPVRHGYLVEWIQKYLHDNGVPLTIELVDEIEGGRTPVEQLVADALQVFERYLAGEAYYDRTNLEAALKGRAPFPDIDFDYLNTLLAYAVGRDWKSVFER